MEVLRNERGFFPKVGEVGTGESQATHGYLTRKEGEGRQEKAKKRNQIPAGAERGVLKSRTEIPSNQTLNKEFRLR